MIKYVSVCCVMSENAYPRPIKIIWEDGRKYAIDKVIDVKKRASTKGGGAGIRYLVKIGNHEKYLFLKDYNWFVELD